MALVWLFASGVAVDQLLVDGGSLPCRPYPAPQRRAPVPANRWGSKLITQTHLASTLTFLCYYFTTTEWLDSMVWLVSL